MKIIIVLFLITSVFNTTAQENRILIVGATVHVGNGEVIPKGLVGFTKGKLTLVKNALAYTYKTDDWDSIISMDGKHLYPGLVATNSILGISEIEQVRASNDQYEVGEYNPNVRSIIAYNCESDVLETVRSNGVLIIQTTPRGGIISGTSSIMSSTCWNWEDGTIKQDDGMHITWPSVVSRSWNGEGIVYKNNENYQKEINELKQFFANALAHMSDENKQYDTRYDAIEKCIKSDSRFYFHADKQQELLDILDFASNFDIKYPVLIGGSDAHLIASKLVEKKIPVMIQRPHALPKKDESGVDEVFQNAQKLKEAGVKFCIHNEGEMEAMNARNIPFWAGQCIGYGLTEEEALQTITLSACEILGIDKNFGSVEEGKNACFFVSTGPALDMRTNNTEIIVSSGEIVSPLTFQHALYKKYKQKLKL